MLYPSLVWNGPAGTQNIFLTFDDGPVPGVTEPVLDILAHYGVRATFFCVGENIHRQPDLFRRVYGEGHMIGNHTYHHLDGWRTGYQTYLDDLLKCEEAIEDSGFSSPVKLFRPPYGKIRSHVIPRIRETYRIIMWDVLSYDFSSLPVEKLLDRCRKHASPGSIIVFHDSEKTARKTPLMISQLIEYLLRNDYQFLTLDKLFLSN